MFNASVTLRRLRFWNQLFFAYLKRYQLRITAVSLLFLLVFIGFFKIWPIISRSNVISIGYVGTYSIENIPTEILTLVTQSLITVDNQGRPIPLLASHWTVSDDGKTYIVFLKDNLTWHDSTIVDTGNISLAISNVEITSLNNKAIQFNLPNPITSFPQALDKPIFKSKTFYGTGEYRIVKIDKLGETVKRIFLHPKNPKLPRVEIKFYQNEVQAKNALKLGEINVVNTTNAQDLLNWPNLTVEKQADLSETVIVFFNNQDPLLSSKELRQALTYAINRTDFDGQRASSPISPSSWAYSENLDPYNYNISKAKELISKIKSPQQLKITLSVAPGLEHIARSIKSDWQALDIEVEIKEIDKDPKNFQALLAINRNQPDPDQYALWHSTQNETNIANYKNFKVDKLLEDARSIRDEEQRKGYYLEFQKVLVEDAPAAFLYHPFRYEVVYKNTKHLLEKLSQDFSIF